MSASLSDMHEIDALPDRSVVVDAEGDVWQYRRGLWCSYETSPIGSERLARKYGPVTVLSRGSHGVTELDGATIPPPEGHMLVDAGQFAAAWNNAQPDERERWWRDIGDRLADASKCLLQNHAGLVEQNRHAFMQSVDLGNWADAMRRFADTWVDRPSNGSTIYSLIVMEGEGEHRHEVEHAVTVNDLRKAAAIAQHLAHDRIDHAVFVKVDEWEDHAGNTGTMVSVDGRILLDYDVIEQMLIETGWSKS